MTFEKDLSLKTKLTVTAIFLVSLVIILFFLSNHFSTNDVNLIKDLLSIASTIFAALMAVYISQEWIKQKRIESVSSLSEYYLSKMLEVSIEHVNFVRSLNLLVRLLKYVKNKKDQDEDIDDFQSVSNIMKNHPFQEYIFDFENIFGELKQIMQKEDIELYDKVSQNIKSYYKLIYEDNAFEIYYDSKINMSNLKADIDVLSKETHENLNKLRQKLIDYKIYNFNKK